MYTLDQIIEKVNHAVGKIEYNHEPHNLYDPIRYILSIGGKRIRPALMLMGYNLYKNIKYPSVAQDNGIQGRVLVQFVVNKDGSIVDPKVLRSVDPSLDKEAMRVVQAMPKWTPGKQRGKPVRVRFTLPVTFRLQ